MTPDVELFRAPSEDDPDIPDEAGNLDGVADVECPWCDAEGKTIHEFNLCSHCGCWFEVTEN